MSADQNFSLERRGLVLLITNTSGPFSLVGPSDDLNLVKAAEDVLIYNPGPLPVYLQAGDPSTVALAPGDDANYVSMVVPPGFQPFRKGHNTSISGKAVGGSQSITVYVGNGA